MVDDIEVLNKWLSVCEDHEKCNAVLDRSCKDERPSRLICITDNAVKLVLTEQWETMPRYATLSYCWGGADFIKTTRDKLDAFLNDIPFESLPKTFQDAIDISRRLGIEYIWIDALCIVQAQGEELLKHTHHHDSEVVHATSLPLGMKLVDSSYRRRCDDLINKILDDYTDKFRIR